MEGLQQECSRRRKKPPKNSSPTLRTTWLATPTQSSLQMGVRAVARRTSAKVSECDCLSSSILLSDGLTKVNELCT